MKSLAKLIDSYRLNMSELIDQTRTASAFSSSLLIRFVYSTQATVNRRQSTFLLAWFLNFVQFEQIYVACHTEQ